MTTPEVEDLAVRYGAAWAERDLNAIMAMPTDDTARHAFASRMIARGISSTVRLWKRAVSRWAAERSSADRCLCREEVVDGAELVVA